MCAGNLGDAEVQIEVRRHHPRRSIVQPYNTGLT